MVKPVTPPYGVLIVLGHMLPLSVDARLRTIAARDLYKGGLVTKIIFTGGKTAGETKPSEAEEMVLYLKRIFRAIPGGAILHEGASFNTQQNAANVKVLLRGLEDSRLSLLTSHYHLSRAAEIFRIHGMDVLPLAAEDLLSSRRHYPRFLKKYMQSSAYRLKVVFNFALRVLLFVDPKGYLPGLISRRRGRGT
jgi:uncharacterized SAM-binding protein YcdF (DUF218 family)